MQGTSLNKKLPKYVRDRTKLETASDSLLNMGEMYLTNKALVGEGIKIVLLEKLRETMDFGRDMNSLAK